MKTLSVLVLGLLALSSSPAAFAQRVVLDDSLSPRQNFSLDLKWGPRDVQQALGALFTDQNSLLPPVPGYLSGVEVRLDTSQFVGQRVRIFLLIPEGIAGDSSGGTLEVAWQARGVFESGSARPGQAVLIFEGLLEKPITSGTFDFAITAASTGITDSFSFELTYELEVIN